MCNNYCRLWQIILKIKQQTFGKRNSKRTILLFLREYKSTAYDINYFKLFQNIVGYRKESETLINYNTPHT